MFKAGSDNLRTRDLPVVNDIEGRLKRLENTVHQLTDSVNRALQAITFAPPGTNTGISSWNSRSLVTNKCWFRVEAIRRPLAFFLLPKGGIANIDAIRQSPGDVTSQSAHSKLQYLSGRLTTVESDQQIVEDSTTFYIPSKATGYPLISSNVSFLQGYRSALTF